MNAIEAKSIVKDAAEKLSPATYISMRVRQMERAEVDALAVAYLLAQVKMRKRSVVLETERDAQVKHVFAVGTGYGGAPTPELAAEWKQQDDKQLAANRATRSAVDAAIRAQVEAAHTEWNDRLLRSKFALGDGTETTWGEATREQHQYRFDMHKTNAVAGVEGAARHLEAIEKLDATGCLTLTEAVTVTA